MKEKAQKTIIGTKISTSYGDGVLDASRYMADGSLAVMVNYEGGGGHDVVSINLGDYAMWPGRNAIFIPSNRRGILDGLLEAKLGTADLKRKYPYGPYDAFAYKFKFTGDIETEVGAIPSR